MTMTLRITDRDHEIVEALNRSLRVLSQGQIAEHWFDGERANARRRLRQLTQADYLIKISVRARTLPTLERPVLTWRPGEAEPPFERAAYTLRSRWTGRAVRTVTAYIASRRAGRLFGTNAAGELKKPTQAGHDLGVAQVWLKLAAAAPPWARAWRGEDLMAHTRRGEKLPDAFIVNDDKVVSVIEFGGAYDQERLREFHEDCRQRELPYQIW